MPRMETRDVAINIRARAKQRDLIDRAAEALGRNRSDFMIEAACNEARRVLLDQTFFALDAKAFDNLSSLLEQPVPRTNRNALKHLLARKAPWER